MKQDKQNLSEEDRVLEGWGALDIKNKNFATEWSKYLEALAKEEVRRAHLKLYGDKDVVDHIYSSSTKARSAGDSGNT